MIVSELIEQLTEWDQFGRVSTEGEGDILFFESDDHGGLLIICGETVNRRDREDEVEEDE